MTKEGYWNKNKTKLQLNERSYNAFEMGVKFCENKIADIKANCDLAIEGRDVKIMELEKENAELKEKLEGAEKARDYWKGSSFDWRHKCTSRKPFRVAVKAQKQLTKAKDHIKQLLDCLKQDTNDPETNYYVCKYMDEAEQFLKEIEK